ncbi:MAG: hypothetical protein KAI57_04860, partial [Candidatus Pacebacteria bacterium]|nr:hypothetical protein [Candidatus Paceibacterota bacterium]
MTNEEQALKILKQNQEILLKTHKSVEKTRKYILYNVIFTVVVFVLPLIGLVIAIPLFMKTYMSSL